MPGDPLTDQVEKYEIRVKNALGCDMIKHFSGMEIVTHVEECKTIIFSNLTKDETVELLREILALPFDFRQFDYHLYLLTYRAYMSIQKKLIAFFVRDGKICPANITPECMRWITLAICGRSLLFALISDPRSLKYGYTEALVRARREKDISSEEIYNAMASFTVTPRPKKRKRESQ